MNPPNDIRDRINRLHAWYQANVLPQRQTYAVECLWLRFFQQGYNGQDLAKVVRYLRWQISSGKRNEGSLKLHNLLATNEQQELPNFDADLALASARDNLRRDKRLAPVPDGEPSQPESSQPHQPHQPKAKESGITPEMRAARVREFAALRKSISEGKRYEDTQPPFMDPNNTRPQMPHRIAQPDATEKPRL